MMAARLARFRDLLVDADGAPVVDVQHLLAPFLMADESLAVIHHLREAGVPEAALDAALVAGAFDSLRSRS